MPWETKTVMKQREEFVEAAEANSVSFSALCREYGISRKTGYKWLKRAQMGQQLLDKSLVRTGSLPKLPKKPSRSS